MAVGTFHEFADRKALATQLAADVRSTLEMRKGEGRLALSGGSTPKLFLQHLVPLPACSLFLVDDRFVCANNERSNQGMVSKLLQLKSDRSLAISLYQHGVAADAAATSADAAFAALGETPLDFCVLGMGTDGHTASWFPGGNNLQRATDANAKETHVSMMADGAGEPRITMTLPVIASAKKIALHIEGAEKRTVFEKALEDGLADDMPIRHILRHPTARVDIYWAP